MNRLLRPWMDQARALYPMAQQATPPWLRPILAGCVGAGLAVFLGWVDTHGDAIRIYLGLIGVILAASAAFVGGRVINEAADRRDIRRSMHAALVRLLNIAALHSTMDEAIDVFESAMSTRKATDAEVESVAGALQVAMVLAKDHPPDMDDFLDTPDDRRHAQLVALDLIVLRDYGVTDFANETSESRRARISGFVRNLVDRANHRRAIDEAIQHFELKLSKI